jgi:ArsR family transcriptional regulator
MPYRAVVSAELAKLFSVLSHPLRIRIIEELQKEDLTVSAIKDLVGVSPSAVSQQLAVLRSNHLLSEKRQGRNVFYHLRKPELARWIMEGVNFISPDASEIAQMMSAIQSVKTIWAEEPVKKRVKQKKSV